MTGKPSAPHLERIISALDVTFVHLTECLVGPGFGLQLGEVPAPGLHFNLEGHGKGYLKDGTAIDLAPRTLVIVPANTSFRIEIANRSQPRRAVQVIDSLTQFTGHGPVNRLVASTGSPEIVLICGFFHARYGVSTDLFQTVRKPIVATFSPDELVEFRLRAALKELIAQELGSGAMSASLLKQVIISLIRRSLNMVDGWSERFGLLRDEQIARAFAQMAAHPGAPHSISTLAKAAALSRSAFMERFVDVVGRPPMEVLRDLRMKQAAQALQNTELTVEQIANQVGYASRSSFVRAFRSAHDVDPTAYRATRS